MVHQEGEVGCAFADLIEGFGGFAEVRKILLVADRFFGELQDAFEQNFVELHDVEGLLAGGEAGEEFRCGWFGRVQEESAVGGDREQRGAGAAFFTEEGGGAGGVQGWIDFCDFEIGAGGGLEVFYRE